MDKQTFITRVNELLPGYKASEAVLRQLATVKLIALVGPTGAGKSTICRRSGIPCVIGDTTRQPRDREVNGQDYNFRTDYETMLSEIQNGEYVQVVVQRGTEMYGTKASSFPAGGVCAMSIIASVIPVFKLLGFQEVLPVYITPPSYTEWMHRIASHHDKDLEGRLLEAKDSLSIALNTRGYLFLLNDDVETAANDLRKIANGVVDPVASNRGKAAAAGLYRHLQKVIR